MRRVALAAAAALAVAGCSSDQDTKVYRVPSSSMEPTLHCARPGFGCQGDEMDRVAARPYGESDPARGDIVVFHTPPLAAQECGAGGTFIKRVIALPGEVWRERVGVVYINGRKLNEPYVRPQRRDSETYTLAEIPPRGRYSRVPDDMYVLMGDNRASSCDSRRWGLVPRRSIIGRVFEIKRGSKRIHIR
jgi:signal peptidase I